MKASLGSSDMSSARCIASSVLSRLSDAVDVCSQHESALLVRLLSSDNLECRLLRIDEGQATELDIDSWYNQGFPRWWSNY